MDKKYELLNTNYGWYIPKALKDFALITGETVKKGDTGGFIRSEDCLSQEGNCWVMGYAYVSGKASENAVVKNCAKVYGDVSGNAIVKKCAKIYGKVSENAVIKDYVEVYGEVSGNAIVEDCGYVYGTVSGNTIVKDFAEVRENATVTGNAIVQAHQLIIHGIVTTDILSTKDWASALYAEFGIVPENGKVILYKAVNNTDNPEIFKSLYKPSFLYEVGKTVEETDVDEDVMKVCGKGLHFTSLEFIDKWGGDTILECEVAIEDIITVQGNKVRARKCKVLRSL